MRVLRLVLLNVAVFAALAIAIEGTSSFVRRARTLAREPVRSEPGPFIRYDAELGWSLRPGTTIAAPGDAALRINANGTRGARDIGALPSGRARVICSGDSFTFGQSVGDDATWCAQLETLDPRIEAVNLGVPGYGADQAYLRYVRDARHLGERVHVFAIIDDDFRRMSARGDKPYLTAEGGRLSVHNVPVPPAARPSRLGEAFVELNAVQLAGGIANRLRRARGTPVDGPADGVLAAMVDALVAAGRERHSAQIVVRLPSFDPPSPYMDAFLAAARRSLVVVDLRERFRSLPSTSPWGLFLDGAEPGSHPNADGHAWIARMLQPAIADALRE